MRFLISAAAIILIAAPTVSVRGQVINTEPQTLDASRLMFYNGRYSDSAAAASNLCVPGDASALSACELRTSALLFQLRRALGDAKDRDKAFKECLSCPALLAAFVEDTRRAQQVARAHLKANPSDDEVRFLLGRIDLNYVWLQLGTLGHKTGWDEYWEARKSLDAVLKQNAGHVRAKVARAWIDYIVDTKMPLGTRWVLGGGDKKKGLKAVREAATADADMFVRAEAAFALWDMQVREKKIPDALITAQALVEDFPENPDLQRFLAAHIGPTER